MPLKCFRVAGGDVARLERLPVIEREGTLDLALSRMALGAGNDAQCVVDSPLR